MEPAWSGREHKQLFRKKRKHREGRTRRCEKEKNKRSGWIVERCIRKHWDACDSKTTLCTWSHANVNYSQWHAHAPPPTAVTGENYQSATEDPGLFYSPWRCAQVRVPCGDMCHDGSNPRSLFILWKLAQLGVLKTRSAGKDLRIRLLLRIDDWRPGWGYMFLWWIIKCVKLLCSGKTQFVFKFQRVTAQLPKERQQVYLNESLRAPLCPWRHLEPEPAQ